MWKRLDYDDMKLYLSEDELTKLSSYSTDLSSMIDDELDVISDAFRGAFQSKGYILDIRPHYTPPQYKHFILAYARYSCWTRFPMADNYALSEPRKEEYEYAKKMLENPKIGVELPDYSDDPELSGRTDLSVQEDAALTIPWLKLNKPDTGFLAYQNPYWTQIEKSRFVGWY